MSSGPAYTVNYTRKAFRDLKKLPIETVVDIVTDISELKSDPRPPASRQLSGHADLHRLRSGDYRTIYRIDDQNRLIEIARVRHRREVYDDL